MIKWAFDGKQGDVSEPFNMNDQFVVAIVNKVQAEGLPDANTARSMVEFMVRNERKADEIIKKLSSANTLEAAAAAYHVQIGLAGADSLLTYNAQIINGIGQEPKIIGAAFNKAYLAKVSEPIAGNNGVFVIKVNSVGSKVADTVEVAAAQAAEKTKSMVQNTYSFFESLKKGAEIKDNRSKVF